MPQRPVFAALFERDDHEFVLVMILNSHQVAARRRIIGQANQFIDLDAFVAQGAERAARYQPDCDSQYSARNSHRCCEVAFVTTEYPYLEIGHRLLLGCRQNLSLTGINRWQFSPRSILQVNHGARERAMSEPDEHQPNIVKRVDAADLMGEIDLLLMTPALDALTIEREDGALSVQVPLQHLKSAVIVEPMWLGLLGACALLPGTFLLTATTGASEGRIENDGEESGGAFHASGD